MYKILIVEDDEVIAKTLKVHLEKWGYEAVCVQDFNHVMECFVKEQPSIVLMDIGLPFFNGYHWCTQIRNISQVPVIFLSSMSDNMNIVMAMNMGGDDFITKPYDLNVNDQTFTYEGKKAELTKNEFRILQILMENTGKVVSRDKIMEKLWEDESFIDDNTLTVNVTRLRKKLEETGIQDYIKTKKGAGYLIE